MKNQLFATKSLAQLLAEMAGENRLRRVLGPVQLTSLGVGAIIGAGIFVATGAAARNIAGPALMLSYVVAGITCIFAALCYAEFASMVPVAGSAYTYAYATLGELFAWIIGWDLILEYAVGAATVANGWSGYFQSVLAKFDLHFPAALAGPPIVYDTAAGHFVQTAGVVNLPAILVVAVVTAVLVKGISESASFNATMVFLKVTVVLFVILTGAFYVNPANWRPFAPYGMTGVSFFGHTLFGQVDAGGQPVGMLAGAAIIFFAYIGFDAVSTVAEETRNPKRDMPFGIIGSLILCTVIYIVIALVFTGMIPYAALKQTLSSEQAEPLTLAMKYAAMPNWMVGVVAFGSVVAHTAVLLVFQMGQPRIFFSMARDGLLPPVFAKVHPKFRTPHVTTILTGVAVAVTSAFTSLDEMVNLTNVGTAFAFILISLGIIILRFREPNRERPFKVPFGPFVFPLLGVICCVAVIYYLPHPSWWRFVGWLAIGIVVYFLYGFRHSRLRGTGAGNR